MKRVLIFLLALVCAVSLMAADNQTVTTQGGDGNQVSVDQVGSDHSSVINQSNSSSAAADGHQAYVNQNSGDNNSSDILQDQRGALVNVDQVGSDNKSGIKQSGLNEADIDQIGNENVLGSYSNLNNRAFMKNGTWWENDKNWLTVKQVGDQNKAGSWQEHHATSDIYQEGNGNTAKVRQSGSAAGAINSSDVDQVGGSNLADVNTFGDGNSAEVFQGGDSNDSKIDQDGDGNSASAKMSASAYSSSSNSTDMLQDGDDNDASFAVTWGDFNNVDIDQVGDMNYTETSVKYGDSNKIKESVTGDENRTRFHINAAWNTESSENDLLVTKTGNKNYVSGSIAGDLNNIDVVQDGNNNRVGTSWHTGDGIKVAGDNNVVSVSQWSDGNSSLNDVAGNGNSILINQN